MISVSFVSFKGHHPLKKTVSAVPLAMASHLMQIIGGRPFLSSEFLNKSTSLPSLMLAEFFIDRVI